MSELNRRGLITGLVAFIAAPAIVRAGSLMPVKQMLASAADVLPPPLPVWEEVEWVGRYLFKLKEGEAAEWVLLEGPGFDNRAAA